MLEILCYKNRGIHWYPCHPTFLWKINFRLVWRLISALIWDSSGLGNPSDGRDFREKRIDMSRFLRPYMIFGSKNTRGGVHVLLGIWNQNSITVIYENCCSYLSVSIFRSCDWSVSPISELLLLGFLKDHKTKDHRWSQIWPIQINLYWFGPTLYKICTSDKSS